MADSQGWQTVKGYDGRSGREDDRQMAARSRDPEALTRLLAPHERALYTLCRGILGHAEDAEDAVQESFLRALKALPGFRGDAAIRTWLMRIALNVCLEWKRARRSPESLSDTAAITLTDPATPETIVLQQMQILEALQTLLPRHRAIFLLKELEGWSVAEIASALRCSRRHIYYALDTAHRTFAEWQRPDARKGTER